MYRHQTVAAAILLVLVSSTAGVVSPVLASTGGHSSATPRACARSAAGRQALSCARSSQHAPEYLSHYGTLWSAAVDGQGHVFVLDRATAHLLKLSSSGHLLGSWAIPPIYVPTQPPDLTGITIGPHHTLYVTDAYNYQVVTLTTKGQIIASWDTRHVKNWRQVGPFGVARDAQGNLYVPNFAFSDVEKYSPRGKRLMTFGRACPQASGSETATSACADEGHMGLGELNHPDSIALDPQGNIYVSDHRSKRIVKFGPDGKEIASFGPELPAPYGSLGMTEGVVVDRQGNIYVEDRNGPRVVKLSPTGVPVAQWHAPKGYTPEGTPGIDAAGNIYLTLNSDKGPCMVVTLSSALHVHSSWM